MADDNTRTVCTVDFSEDGPDIEMSSPCTTDSICEEMDDELQDCKPRFQVQRVPSVRREGPKPSLTINHLLALESNDIDLKRNTLTFGGTTYMTRNSLGSLGSHSDICTGQFSPYHTYTSGHHSLHGHLSPYGTYNGQLSPTGTHNFKTFGRDTQEALPHVDHYRNLMSAITAMKQRPTLYELHEEQVEVPHQHSLIPLEKRGSKIDKDLASNSNNNAVKFGWIQGVLVRCLLNIFGVMLFLRLSWVTGQAGIGLASVIILLSGVVTVLTTMSMSAICTNGEVKGGGAYYMISRSLGPEFGGAIGIVFSLANAVAAAMYVVGFGETVVQLMTEHNVSITGNALNDIRIIGCVTSVLLISIVVVGMEWESKAQLVLLFILIVAIVNFIVGTFIPPSLEKQQKGVSGYSGEVFMENFVPDFRHGEGFFTVFAVFFPAATGILAGANISGDLKDPQKAIPKGTFLAILITTIVYLAMVWMCGSVLLRDAAGPIAATLLNSPNMTGSANGSLFSMNVTELPSTFLSTDSAFNSTCSKDGPECPFGSINYNYSVGLASAFRPLILAGIFAATLSSALASLVSAPKVFQAVGKDKLFPGTYFFAKPYGKSGEPIRGYALTFLIAIAVTCIADLNVIAPIISNFFLMAYTLINFSCFDVSLAKTPGFRPAFKYYNKWLSLIGALLCLAVMFVINWWAALVTFVVVGGLYLYIRQAKPDVNWGSSTQAHAYQNALKACRKLTNVPEHVKNFRPQILVLSGNPENRPNLVDFAASITKRQSLLLCGHVLKGELSEHLKHLRSKAASNWLRSRKVKAYYCGVVSPDLRHGSQVLLQVSGLGKLRPNTLLLGYKSDWLTDDKDTVDCYFNIIHDAFDLQYGVGVLRVPEGFDLKKIADDLLGTDENADNEYQSSDEDDDHVHPAPSEVSGSSDSNPNPTPNGKVAVVGVDNPVYSEETRKQKIDQPASLATIEDGLSMQTVIPNQKPDEKHLKNVIEEEICFKNTNLKESRFRLKQHGTIDVWWMFDDGGLTLLIPYILSTRASWKNCKLRVFCAGTKQGNFNEDQRRIATLLHKFRIDYSQLTVISDLGQKPKPESIEEYEKMMSDWKVDSNNSDVEKPWMIDEAEFLVHKPKTHRHLKLREHLLKESKDASLIVMTLPVPKKATTSAGLYLSWLETLTKDMPPILLLRGNQQNVLTFYS